MPILTFSRRSIRGRLTFSICIQLLIVMLIFGGFCYIEAKKIAVKSGHSRLKGLSEQLVAMLTENVHDLISTTYSLADKPAISKYLLSNGKDSAEETRKLLETFLSDTLFVQAELKNVNGITLINSARNGKHLDIHIDSVFTSLPVNNDTGWVEKIHAFNNCIYFPIIVNIIDEKKMIGYLVRWRKISLPSRSFKQLSQLFGSSTKIYIGNNDGILWTDLRQPVVTSPVKDVQTNNIIEYAKRPKNSAMIIVSQVKNSKWLMAVELSMESIQKAVDRFLYWLLVAGGFLLIIGFFIAWMISRSISQPIKNLTMANSLLASGNYLSFLNLDREDEIGKLARAFNGMAIQVQHSREELEKKALNYKLLFERNPMPMWIISEKTLDVIDVNNAAIDHYGYSREEFLKLNSKDLAPCRDVKKHIDSKKAEYRGILKHKKKNGTIIMVDIITDSINYKDQAARLILANDVTEKLNAEAELMNHRILQQELITEATIQVQEKEREELGKELHDNINQILASTKLYLELALAGNRETMDAALSKSYQNVTFIIEEIRKLSKKLVPPSLDTTLAEAIQDLIDEIQAIAPVKLSLKLVNFNEKLLNENIKLMLYRIVQEQINNIIKHSSASQVEIKISISSTTLDLTMIDNGIGFDTNTKSKGIGLRNIDNRVKFYNGITQVISHPGKGCRLEISIPVQKVMNGISTKL